MSLTNSFTAQSFYEINSICRVPTDVTIKTVALIAMREHGCLPHLTNGHNEVSESAHTEATVESKDIDGQESIDELAADLDECVVSADKSDGFKAASLSDNLADPTHTMNSLTDLKV